ncbi:MAG: antibiotic biosynthesis monooxygenase [Pseudomonadota bacterium]
MIVRTWHGKVPIARADAYAEFLKQRAVPDYGAVPGLRRVAFLRREQGKFAHFLLVTHWESMDAVKAFAGPDPEIAKYYPEDDEFLVDRAERLQLYEVFFER